MAVLGYLRYVKWEFAEGPPKGQLQPLSIISSSTQAPTDADLLSVLIDDALAGHDPHTMCSLYTAPADADPFDTQNIKRTNPALGIWQNPDAVLQMAESARPIPSREAAYRRLVLDQPVEASSPFAARQ